MKRTTTTQLKYVESTKFYQSRTDSLLTSILQ